MRWSNQIHRDDCLQSWSQICKDPEKECPNCGETNDPCACMRNKCVRCGEPVGNITFTICDDCWEKEHYINQGWDERIWGRDLPNDDTTNSK